MPATLYLDTARLGPMSPLAQRMLHDFSRLTAEDPASLYIDDFLRSGFSSLPDEYQSRFADLAAWPGITGLKDQLRQFVSAPSNSTVLIAGRSQSLMKLAARCLFRRCRNVLTADLSWPAYQQLLEDEARRTGHGVIQFALRERLVRRQTDLDQVVTDLALAARRHRCDGLFLPTVDNFGIRLPISDIVTAIRQRTDLHFIALDAAQAIGHIPLTSDIGCSDLVIAGTHKWLGGYLPLGLAFAPNERTQSEIIETSQAMPSQADLDDPLLDFLTDLESNSLRHHTETINLTPLLTCCGALQDFACPDRSVADSLAIQLRNAEIIHTLAIESGWQPLLSSADQRTGIVLLQSDRVRIQATPAEILRRELHHTGIAATTYDDGIIRLSMPRTVLTPDSTQRLSNSLRQLSTDQAHITSVNGDCLANRVTISACGSACSNACYSA